MFPLVIPLPLVHMLVLYVPLLGVAAVLHFLGKPIGTLTKGTAVERSRARVLVVLGGLFGATALTAAVAMILLGGPC